MDTWLCAFLKKVIVYEKWNDLKIIKWNQLIVEKIVQEKKTKILSSVDHDGIELLAWFVLTGFKASLHEE